MTDPVKKVKNASQDAEAIMKTSEDHAEGKPSSEILNKAKVKARDALTWTTLLFFMFLWRDGLFFLETQCFENRTFNVEINTDWFIIMEQGHWL